MVNFKKLKERAAEAIVTLLESTELEGNISESWPRLIVRFRGLHRILERERRRKNEKRNRKNNRRRHRNAKNAGK